MYWVDGTPPFAAALTELVLYQNAAKVVRLKPKVHYKQTVEALRLGKWGGIRIHNSPLKGIGVRDFNKGFQ